MTRKKLLLSASCLFGFVMMATIAQTQDVTPKPSLDIQAVPPDSYNNVPGPSRFHPSGRIPTPTYDDPDGTIAYRQKYVTRTVREMIHVPVSPEEVQQLKSLQKAKQNLKDARDEGARQAATDVIKKHLIKQFEQDLSQREKELQSVEERLKTLRQQLEKRKLAKDEIVSLRLKTIVNDAEGLGFPGGDDSLEGGPVIREGEYFDPSGRESVPSYSTSPPSKPNSF